MYIDFVILLFMQPGLLKRYNVKQTFCKIITTNIVQIVQCMDRLLFHFIAIKQ